MPVTISGDGGIAGVSSFGFTNFANNGTFTTSGGDVGICRQSPNRQTVFIDNSANRVGINTVGAPDQLVVISDSTPTVSIQDTNTNTEVQVGVDGAGVGYIGTETNNSFDIETNSATRVTVLGNGNVGINTTTPTEHLTVIDASTEQGRILTNGLMLRDNYGTTVNIGNGIISQATNTLNLCTDSVEQFRVSSNSTNAWSAIVRPTAGPTSSYDGGGLRINAGTVGAVNIQADTLVTSSVTGNAATYVYATDVPGWSTAAQSTTRLASILQLQRNGTVNNGFLANDSTAIFSVGRYSNANNANPYTRLLLTLRDTPSSYNSIAFDAPGYITFPNGGGLNFSAGMGAGAASSILADYEEGTWNPSLEFSGGVTVINATYIKIGTQVTLFIYFRDGASGPTSGSSYVSNLPFTPAVTEGTTATCNRRATSNGVTVAPPSLFFAEGVGAIYIQPNVDFSGQEVTISATYQTT